MKVINPATEEVIATLTEDTVESLQKKYLLLKEGQKAWSRRPLSERISILKKFSTLLETESERLATVLTSEVGKPLQQSRNEIKGAIARITWLVENGEKYLADEWMTREDGLGERITYEPLGVVCNISAWNYPYLVGVNVFIPALMAGNAVMYKPSEFSSLTGLEIDRLLKKSGVPEDAFQTALREWSDCRKRVTGIAVGWIFLYRFS
jgi:acyl-CoA reductase-like NAD-dependent aldehyde dehydrogenase